jgi:MFS family permease
MKSLFIRQKVYHPHTLIGALYIASIFYSLHYALTIYLQAVYLEKFIQKELFGIVYIISSLLSIYVSFKAFSLLGKYKNYKVTLFAASVQMTALFLMAFTEKAVFALSLFLITQVFTALLFISLNVSLEEVSKKGNTGSIRGVFLTIINLGIIAAALFSGIFYEWFDFSGVFIASALCLIPLIYITHRYTHTIQDPHFSKVNILDSFKKIYHNKNLKDIAIVQFILGCFYSVMVVYGALYIHETGGIPMTDVLKVIMPLALLPFIIFPYELGVLADTKLGEKEMLITGLLIASLSVLALPFIVSSSLFVWAFVFFMTRVGASFIETMSSVYFYKKVHKEDVGVIALFNNLGTFAMIFMSLISTVLIGFLGFGISALFYTLAIILLLGIYFALSLKDTL